MNKEQEIAEKLDGSKVAFLHSRGSAYGEHFANDEKVGRVVNVEVDNLRKQGVFPIKLELQDGCNTYIDLDEITNVISE